MRVIVYLVSLPRFLPGRGLQLGGMILLGLCASMSADDAPVIETILSFQRDCGGWPKNYDRSRALDPRERRVVRGQRSQSDTTIDNGATYTEIRLLASAFQAAKEQSIAAAALQGIDYLLVGQMDNGGWPQRFPNGRGYSGQVTFNDNAMIGVLNLLKDIVEEKPLFQFVPAPVRQRCATAVDRGLSCILRCQVVVGGVATSWCAQHDRHSLAPCRGRSYELPSLSGMESVGIIRFLMRVENPDEAVMRAIRSGVAWFERVRLTGLRVDRVMDHSKPKGFDYLVLRDSQAGPLWARFYDTRSNQPIFSSRDGIPKATLAEISYERRTGYSWLGPYAQDLLQEDFPLWCRRHTPAPLRSNR